MNSSEFNNYISYTEKEWLFLYCICKIEIVLHKATKTLTIHSTKFSELLCNLAFLKHVLWSIMWNWCNNCGWTPFLPKANVQTSYVRPIMLFLPNTFSHGLYLVVWHRLRTLCKPPPKWFVGYYEISLWEKRFLASPVFCSTLCSWTQINLLDATAPVNPLTAPSIIMLSVLVCWCSVWPSAVLSHRSDTRWLRHPAG